MIYPKPPGIGLAITIMMNAVFKYLPLRSGLSKLCQAMTILAVTLTAFYASAPATAAKQTIVALVNDEPISAFDLNQRVQLFLVNSQQLRTQLQARLKSPNINQEFREFAMRHNPRSKEEVKRLQQKFVKQIRGGIIKRLRPQARKLAMNELIEERIKLQEAKRLNIVVSDEDVTAAFSKMASQNKMTGKQFSQMMRRAGVNVNTMKQRMKANMSWSQAVQRKYGRELSLTNNYLDRELDTAAAASDAQKNIELQLQRITLPISGRINQQIMVEKFAEADQLRSSFKSCQSVRTMVANIENAKYENLGRKRASSFPEPTRTQLIQAKIGQMPPPSLSPQGIQLYAVCGRKKVSTTDKKNVAKKRRRKMLEFNILAERHLRDLKQDAFIEYR